MKILWMTGKWGDSVVMLDGAAAKYADDMAAGIAGVGTCDKIDEVPAGVLIGWWHDLTMLVPMTNDRALEILCAKDNVVTSNLTVASWMDLAEDEEASDE